jgi:hypothetical protein
MSNSSTAKKTLLALLAAKQLAYDPDHLHTPEPPSPLEYGLAELGFSSICAGYVQKKQHLKSKPKESIYEFKESIFKQSILRKCWRRAREIVA